MLFVANYIFSYPHKRSVVYPHKRSVVILTEVQSSVLIAGKECGLKGRWKSWKCLDRTSACPIERNEETALLSVKEDKWPQNRCQEIWFCSYIDSSLSEHELVVCFCIWSKFMTQIQLFSSIPNTLFSSYVKICIAFRMSVFCTFTGCYI